MSLSSFYLSEQLHHSFLSATFFCVSLLNIGERPKLSDPMNSLIMFFWFFLPGALSVVWFVSLSLSSHQGWRGHPGEAGQCYETLRFWLSSYHQFSSENSPMGTTSELLQKQEQLLDELSDQESSTGWPRLLALCVCVHSHQQCLSTSWSSKTSGSLRNVWSDPF